MFGSPRGLGYLLMTEIGFQNIQVIMSVTLLLVLVAATANTVLLLQDRRLRNPGGHAWRGLPINESAVGNSPIVAAGLVAQ